MKSKRSVKSFAWVASVLALTTSLTAAAALFFVYPPGSWPLLKPYSVHAAEWWQWVLAQPADVSPLLDTTGEHCAQGQSGSRFFLVGSADGSPVVRSCKVPVGKTIIFPVINAAYFAFESDPADQKTESFLRSQVDYIEGAKNLEVEIDGVEVKNVAKFLEESKIFSVTLPANNIFGLDAGFELSPSVDSGYYLAIAPMLPGEHTLHFHGEIEGFVQDVTYELTVGF